MMINEIARDVYDVLLHTETEDGKSMSDIVDIDVLSTDIAKVIYNKTLLKYKDDYK